VGAAISVDVAINGICFTGSTATAQPVNRNIAENGQADSLSDRRDRRPELLTHKTSTALPDNAVRNYYHFCIRSLLATLLGFCVSFLFAKRILSEPFLQM